MKLMKSVYDFTSVGVREEGGGRKVTYTISHRKLEEATKNAINFGSYE